MIGVLSCLIVLLIVSTALYLLYLENRDHDSAEKLANATRRIREKDRQIINLKIELESSQVTIRSLRKKLEEN